MRNFVWLWDIQEWDSAALPMYAKRQNLIRLTMIAVFKDTGEPCFDVPVLEYWFQPEPTAYERVDRVHRKLCVTREADYGHPRHTNAMWEAESAYAALFGNMNISLVEAYKMVSELRQVLGTRCGILTDG